MYVGSHSFQSVRGHEIYAEIFEIDFWTDSFSLNKSRNSTFSVLGMSLVIIVN